MFTFKEWFDIFEIDEKTSLQDWLITFTETTTSTRYSIEINYRSNIEEVLDAFAKICLGYVSAALKQNKYHVKHVYDDKPIRILVSSRNWDDGEWSGVVSFNPKNGGSFIISKGFYNKGRRTVSIQSSKKSSADSAVEITKEIRNMMHDLKNKPDRHNDKLKGVNLKRGPKR